MNDRTSNLLGVIGLAVAARIEAGARALLGQAGETPGAGGGVGHGPGASNEGMRRIPGLSPPRRGPLGGRLVGGGPGGARAGRDRREIALHLTTAGSGLREELLHGRLAAIRPLLTPLTADEQDQLGGLLHKLIAGLPASDAERCHLCRLCDDRVCSDCPIPADFRTAVPVG